MKYALRSASGAALLIGLAGAMPVWAQAPQTVQTNGPQTAAPPAEPTSNDRVIVTGSFIAGTPEDAALPVDVISTDDLKEQGNPSIVQLVKTIPSSGSSVGESNRYIGGAGTASINLRGFGAARTLVLLNGQRMADNPLAAGVDLNFIPQAALGRVEILKDGAAATYGSDAVGGVVNFITRRDVDGFEFEAEYSAIDGSDGDYLLNGSYGMQLDNGNILLAAGYRHRSRLDIHERDWAIRSFADSAGNIGTAGGNTGAANPGVYNPNGATAATRTPTFRDNGCAELGGTLTNTVTVNGVSAPVPVNTANPQTAASVCRFQFSNFNDLVNEEEHFQGHGEINIDLSETLSFHAEATWNRNDVIDQRLSPANLSTQFPTPQSLGGTSGSLATPGAQNFFVPYNVPSYHPGLLDLRTQCAAPLTVAQCAAMAAAGGVDISQVTWRAIAFAGHPTNPDKADHQDAQTTEWRVSAGLAGDINENLHWNANVTWMDNTAITNTNDLLVTRTQLALNGFGSLSTDPGSCAPSERTVANRGNAAVGCYFFNPFTNSVAVSAVNGAANPYFRGNANAAVVNNPRLVEWLYGNYTNTLASQLFVAELIFNGDTGWELGGGSVRWAAGGQFRYDRDKRDYGPFNNYEINPCVDSIDDSTPVCGAPAGPIQFFGSNANLDVDRNVSALFGEVQIPLLDTLEINAAVRYEDYKGGIGSTTNPRLSFKWQPIDMLAFRGSVGTTFRAPSSVQTSNQCATGVANVGGQYRAVRTCGNPQLQPEEADSYNAGVIFELGGFKASIDYFNFAFTGELTVESSARLFAAMFTAAGNKCNDPAFASLQARFTFAGDGCATPALAPGNVLRIDTFNVNGPSTDTSGFDLAASYDWPDFLMAGLDLRLGADFTILDEYARGAFSLLGAPQIEFAPAEDRAGLYDLTSTFFSYPKVRGTLYANVNVDRLNARWFTRYVEGTAPAFGTNTHKLEADSAAPFGYRAVAVGKTDDFWQNDLTVSYQVTDSITVTGSVQNIFDEDPPFAFSNYNYDYTSGNPLGRVFEINVRAKF